MVKKPLTHALGIWFVTLAVCGVHAETQRPPIANFLLKEPVSLMDWGMMRAQTRTFWHKAKADIYSEGFAG